MDTLKLFLAVVVAGGVAGGAYFLLIYQPQQAIEKSKPVTGTVQSATVIEQRATDEAGNDYKPVVTYRYAYAGSTYTNSNLKPGSGYNPYDSEAEARTVIGDYSAGEEVTVYVRPDEPSTSFLIKAHPGIGAYFFTGLFALFALLALAALVKSIADVLLGGAGG